MMLSHSRRLEDGVILLEALIAILLFSIGILGLVGLQAASIKNVNEAAYRAEASALATSFFSTIWTDTSAKSVDNVRDSYASGKPGFDAWVNRTKSAGTLPGIDLTALPPRVVVETGGNTSAAKVVFTIFWNLPGEDASQPCGDLTISGVALPSVNAAHCHTAITEIGKN